MGNKTSQTQIGQQPQLNDSAVAATEESPEFSTARLLKLAFLLTENEAFNPTTQEGVTSLLGENAASLPCDKKSGPFIDMISSITNGQYEGQDPISDIKMTIQQLASCQKSPSNQSLLERIGDFFLNKDGGKVIRRFLLLSKILIECLSLWYVIQQNSPLPQNDALKAFIKTAFETGSLPDGTTLFPPDVLQRASKWDGNLDSLVSFFSIGDMNRAPILLIFNDNFLNQVLENPEIIENPGSSESENLSLSTSQDRNRIVPVTFVKEEDLQKFIAQYLASGNLNS